TPSGRRRSRGGRRGRPAKAPARGPSHAPAPGPCGRGLLPAPLARAPADLETSRPPPLEAPPPAGLGELSQRGEEPRQALPRDRQKVRHPALRGEPLLLLALRARSLDGIVAEKQLETMQVLLAPGALRQALDPALQAEEKALEALPLLQAGDRR